jgi:hypothetical protein
MAGVAVDDGGVEIERLVEQVVLPEDETVVLELEATAAAGGSTDELDELAATELEVLLVEAEADGEVRGGGSADEVDEVELLLVDAAADDELESGPTHEYRSSLLPAPQNSFGFPPQGIAHCESGT